MPRRTLSLALTFTLVMIGVAALQSPAHAGQKRASLDALIEDLDALDDEARDAAIDRLAKMGKRSLEPLVREITGNPEHRPGSGAVLALARMGRTGRSMLSRLVAHPNITSQSRTLYRVGLVGTELSFLTPDLLRVVDSATGSSKRRRDGTGMDNSYGNIIGAQAALLTVGRIATRKDAKKALEAIAKLLEKTEEADDVSSHLMRSSAACALWWITKDEKRCRPLLLAMLDTSEGGPAVERAIYGIGEMGSSAADLVATLEAKAAKGNDELKTVVASALEKVRGITPVDTLARGDS